MRRRCAEYLTLAVLWTSWAHGAEPQRSARLRAGWVSYYAALYRVPVELVEAIIEVESGWDPYAVSPKGAVGLMQLMPETAYKFRVPNRFVVEENIRGGVAYLAWLIHLFHGDLRLAVASYNAGEGRIMPWKLAYSSPGVYEYVQRVAALYRAKRLAEVQHEGVGDNLSLLCAKRNGTDRSAAHRIGTSDGRPRDSGRSSDAFCDGDPNAGSRQLRGSRRPLALSGRALGARAKPGVREGAHRRAGGEQFTRLDR
jgi:transglycosylase-like protein with SLT domain